MTETPGDAPDRLPRVVADLPLDATIEGLLDGRVELLPWNVANGGHETKVQGLYTYGHLPVDGALIDRLPGLKVISNYGVGVDHINLDDARVRGIPVGNTPGVLEATTADLGFALLLASARRIIDGHQYAHSPAFLRHDPGYMLGREVHGSTLGIVGMGRIGAQVARRALAFDMDVLYHNRNRRVEVEQALGTGLRFATKADVLALSDYLILCVPLTGETRGLIGPAELAAMKPTATLINISRGPVVETEALIEALRQGRPAAAALDVTEPEPLPRDHPLLTMPGVLITPHLGSATVQTRRRMAELSVENLLAGLAGRPLPCAVVGGGGPLSSRK